MIHLSLRSDKPKSKHSLYTFMEQCVEVKPPGGKHFTVVIDSLYGGRLLDSAKYRYWENHRRIHSLPSEVTQRQSRGLQSDHVCSSESLIKLYISAVSLHILHHPQWRQERRRQEGIPNLNIIFSLFGNPGNSRHPDGDSNQMESYDKDDDIDEIWRTPQDLQGLYILGVPILI